MPLDPTKLTPFTLTRFRPGACKVTISKDGLLSFWKGGVQKYKLNDVSHLLFYYDKANRAIAIKKASGDEKGAAALRKDRTSVNVAIGSLLAFFQIKVAATATYDLHIHQESGLLYIELEKGTIVPPRRI